MHNSKRVWVKIDLPAQSSQMEKQHTQNTPSEHFYTLNTDAILGIKTWKGVKVGCDTPTLTPYTDCVLIRNIIYC